MTRWFCLTGVLQGPVVPGDGEAAGAISRAAGARLDQHARGVLGRSGDS